MMTSSVFGAKQHISKWSSALAVQTRRHRKNRATQNIGAERVSVFATDQCSYGNRTADRKSTTISGKWFKDYFRLSGAGSGSATTCLFPSILLYEQRYRICFWIARDNRAAQNFKLNGKCIRIRMKWSVRFCAAFFILRQVFGDFSSLTREIGRS